MTERRDDELRAVYEVRSVPRPDPDLAALYLRLADTFDRTSQLAFEHAERYRRNGRSDISEVAAGNRAREAAERARHLASRLR